MYMICHANKFLNLAHLIKFAAMEFALTQQIHVEELYALNMLNALTMYVLIFQIIVLHSQTVLLLILALEIDAYLMLIYVQVTCARLIKFVYKMLA